MTTKKKIKIKSGYYFGKVELDKYFIGTGNYLFDVTEVLGRLPDDVQLAFKLWSHWDKYGKDLPFREHEQSPEEGIGGDFEKSPWYQIAFCSAATLQAFPIPFLYQAHDQMIRPMKFKVAEDIFGFNFISDDLMEMASELYGLEVDFYTQGIDSPVYLQLHGQPVGVIAPYQNIDDELERQHLGHFFASNKLARAYGVLNSDEPKSVIQKSA